MDQTNTISEKDDNEKKIDDAVLTDKRKVDFRQYAGSEKCVSCHKNIYDDNVHTAHYFTTKPAEEKYIKGSFDNGKNVFIYDSDVTMQMEKRDSGLYQVLYYKGVERKALRFDIAVGSGAKGQTFVSWNDNRLTQLPVSYFTAANEWANSPGFPDQGFFWAGLLRPVALNVIHTYGYNNFCSCERT